MSNALSAIERGLVVSVQAPRGGPLDSPMHVAAIAAAATEAGACAVRAEGGADIAAVKAAVSVPVIGLRKRDLEGSAVRITPTLADAQEVVAAGADLLALDATLRPGPGGQRRADLLAQLGSLGLPLLADVDSLEAAIAARDAGAAAVATTLSGYTADATPADPDLELVSLLVDELDCPVFAEGRYASPEAVRAAFDAGAFAVVVGTAITDPAALTARFAAASPRVRTRLDGAQR